MIESLWHSMLQIPTALLGAAALVIVSAILVERALRFKGGDVAARIALIVPWTHAAPAASERTTETMGERLRGAGLSTAEREIARELKKFRIPIHLVHASLLVARACVALWLSIGFWFLAPHLMVFSAQLSLRLVLAGTAGLFGWFLPVLAAQWAAKRRAAIVVAGLPDALELLVICAEGGLALGDGIDRIVMELQRTQPELAEELAFTAADLKVLPSQDQALSRLAERIDAPIVQSVVTTLSQTMRYGTPFAQALRVVAAEIRNEALIRLEERANKLPALLTVPMILFIMPTIFLVVGGPAVLKLVDQLAR